MKKFIIALTTGTAIAATALAPAQAWGGLVQQAVGTTINAIQENERRNAQTRRLEIQAQERATEESILAEVERRVAAERQALQEERARFEAAQQRQAANTQSPQTQSSQSSPGELMDAMTGALDEAMPGLSTMIGFDGLGDSFRAGMGGQIQSNTVSIITGCSSFGDGGLQNAISQGFRVVAKYDWSCGDKVGTKFTLSR